MTRYEEYVNRKRKQYANFTECDLDARFVPYFNNGRRIKVDMCGMVLTGTVGVTTGWKPAFLLMRTKRSIGSPWTLGPQDKVIGVKWGKQYCAS